MALKSGSQPHNLRPIFQGDPAADGGEPFALE